jgi:selenide,water dikinase
LQQAGLLPPDFTYQADIGDDAVVRVINDQVAVVENVDVFTPIHDDPHIQGKIVACNATNDVFAMGATEILSLQALLAYPTDLPEEIVVGVLQGMNDFMKALGSSLSGGQTIKNPIPVFGGIALGLTHPDKVVYSQGAEVGDIVVLTKPLGIQPAMRSYRDLRDRKRDTLLERFDEKTLQRIQEDAVRVMTKSNQEVAKAMGEVGVSAATDITGFGLLGHADNVAALSCVSIVFDTIPVIKGTLELAEFFGHRLKEGSAAETAGGMLVFLHPDKVDDFLGLLKKNGHTCWTIGRAVKPSDVPKAQLAEGVEYIETEFP